MSPPAAGRPEQPVVGVGAVVFRGRRVLLVRRATPPLQDEWSLPGGRQELGETLLEAAAREVREETGLLIRPSEVITAVDSIHRAPDGGIAYHFTLVDVLAESPAHDGEPVAGDDAAAVRWADLDEIDALIAWPTTREVIRLAARRRSAPDTAERRTDPEPPRLRRRPDAGRLMRSPMGALIARPWFDDVSLRLLADWYFPMSRAWAAAILAAGSPARFAELLPEAAPARGSFWLGRALEDVAAAQAHLDEADRRWRTAFFGDKDPAGNDHAGEAARVAAEDARLDAATALGTLRLRFAVLARSRRLPACAWAIPAAAAVDTAHGARLAAPASAYALPDPAPLPGQSRAVRGELGPEYWLCFPSPATRPGGRCWARVYEPEGAVAPPTVIHLHGICVEPEHLRQPLREVESYVRRGLRVVAPEAPFHGRRRLPGQYGGEPFVATAPLGALDLFAAAVRELGLLTRWARAAGSPSVGWSGISLGALTAQLAAVHAAGWPADARADALLLATTSEGVDEIALDSEFARAFGLDRALAAAGWTAERLRRWAPLIEPAGPPVVPAADIFMVLGSADTVAPFGGGLTLARRWAIPPDQVSVRRQGHFSVSAGLMADDSPMAAFARRLRRR